MSQDKDTQLSAQPRRPQEALEAELRALKELYTSQNQQRIALAEQLGKALAECVTLRARLAACDKKTASAIEHPWGAFLRVRARCLKWLRDEMGESPEQTVVTMQMVPEQVRSILDHVDTGEGSETDVG